VDHSFDLVARIRVEQEAFQREVDAFGDPSEYEVRMIYGQRTDIDYDGPSLEEVPPIGRKTNALEPVIDQPDRQKEEGNQASLNFTPDQPDTEEA
jgi:hypothetical protein